MYKVAKDMRRNPIEVGFDNLRKEGKKTLIPYITFKLPSLEATHSIIKELFLRGANFIELGLPFSDPLADGIVIQEANAYVLSKYSVSLEEIFLFSKELKEELAKLVIILMSYYNPIYSFGLEKFFYTAQKSGVEGIIIPDLPPEEAKEVMELAKDANIGVSFLVAPTTSVMRMRLISKSTTGFIYYVSLTGTTGMRDTLADIKPHLTKLRSLTTKPICVGFGISKREHVEKIWEIADGAIVGSALIDIILKNINYVQNLPKLVGDFYSQLLLK